MTIQYPTSFFGALLDTSSNEVLIPSSSPTSLTPQEYVCGTGEGKRLHFCNTLKTVLSTAEDSEDDMDCSGDP